MPVSQWPFFDGEEDPTRPFVRSTFMGQPVPAIPADQPHTEEIKVPNSTVRLRPIRQQKQPKTRELGWAGIVGIAVACSGAVWMIWNVAVAVWR